MTNTLSNFIPDCGSYRQIVYKRLNLAIEHARYALKNHARDIKKLEYSLEYSISSIEKSIFELSKLEDTLC